MASTSLTLEKIEELAIGLFKGETNELKNWLEDSNYTSLCKNILDSEDTKFHAANFAILVLDAHVSRFFYHWDTDFRFNFSQWYHNLIINRGALLMSRPELMASYSKLAGSVIAKGWDNDPRFQEFVRQITTFNPNSEIQNIMLLNVLDEIADSMRRYSVVSFGGIGLASVLYFAFLSLANSDKENVVFSALKAIKSAISYYALGFPIQSNSNSDSDIEIPDFSKKSIVLDPHSTQICLNPDNIKLLFSVSFRYNPDLCFDILAMIIAINMQSIPFENRKLMLIMFMQLVSVSIQMNMDPKTQNQFCYLLLRLRIETELFLPQPSNYDYIPFMKSVYIFSMNILSRSDSIQNGSENTIGTILNIFATFKENAFRISPENLVNIINAKIDIVKAFMAASFRLLENDEDEGIEILELQKCHFSSLLQSLYQISKEIIPEVISVIIDFAQQYHKEDEEETNMSFSQIAFLNNFIINLASNAVTLPQPDVQDKYIMALSDAIVHLFDTFKYFSKSELILLSFLLFLKHFNKFTFLANPSDFSQRVYKNIKEKMNIGSINEMLNLLFELLWQVFQNSDQPHIILESSRALSALLSNHNSFYKYILGLKIVQNLVQLRVEHPFPFISKYTHYKSRIEFHSSLCTILVNNDAARLRAQYLSTYNDALINAGNDEAIWGFLVDFTGFFEFAKKPEHFDMFFYYIFPQRVETLFQLIPKFVTTPVLLFSFLKFWTKVLDEGNKRIQFRHHSPNGLILFHLVVNSLNAILHGIIAEAAVPKITSGSEEMRKVVCYCFRIIRSLLLANYVPYNCFDYYNDKGLIELLTIFRTCLNEVPPNILQQYPKIENLLVRLNNTICSKHLEATNKAEVQCTQYVLQIILLGLRSHNYSVVDMSAKSLSSFMNFSQILSVPKEEISAAACELWHLTIIKYQISVQEAVRDVFARIPEMLGVIHDRMAAFLLPGTQENFENAFAEFVQKCTVMFQSGNTATFAAEMKGFVDCVLKYLRAPTRVFKS